MCYDGPEASSLIGIDVSAHQQQIDWEAVAACGVQYAVIRIGYRGYTEGAIQLDDCFAQNLQGAREAGLQIGVYFFSQALDEQEAREEAAFVLKTLDGQALELPVFFDWEEIDGEARSDVIDRTTLTLLADAFCQEIESGGYAAGIYFNQKFGYEELNLQSLLDYSFWLAEYNPTPTFRYGFQFWQYACDGTIDGITGYRFWEDGTGALILPEHKYTFKYTLEEGRLALKFENAKAGRVIFTAALENGRLILVKEEEAGTAEFLLEKTGE